MAQWKATFILPLQFTSSKNINNATKVPLSNTLEIPTHLYLKVDGPEHTAEAKLKEKHKHSLQSWLSALAS